MADVLELLPCPFCGSTKFNGPHYNGYYGDHTWPHWWIECTECPCDLEVDGKEVGGLIRAWNTRAALAAKPVEPFGYWHQADDPDECEFHLASDVSGDCAMCIPLYLHAPAEQDKKAEATQTSSMVGTNTGHGHVWERPDGTKARCGGPVMCSKCALDAAALKAEQDKENGK